MDAKLLDTSWQEIRLPAAEIRQSISQLRKQVQGETTRFRPANANAGALNAATIVDMSAAVERFCRRLERVRARLPDKDQLDSHPWHGVRNFQLQTIDRNYLPAALEVWQKSLVELGREIYGFAKRNQAPAIARAPMSELWAVARELAALPQLCGEEMWDYLGSLTGERLAKARGFLDRYEKLLELEAGLKDKVLPWELTDLDAAHRHVKAGMLLGQNLDSAATLTEVGETLENLPALEAALRKQQPLLDSLQQAFAEQGRHFSMSAAGLREIVTLQRLVEVLPQKYWQRRAALFDQDGIDQAITALRQALEAIDPLRDYLEPLFILDELPRALELRRLQDKLNRGGRLKWMDREWRSAKDLLCRFAAAEDPAVAELVAALPKAIEFRERLDALDADKDLRAALGEFYQGADTDLHALSCLRNWYCAVRKEYGAGFGPRVALGDLVLQMPADLAGALRQMTRHQEPSLGELLKAVGKVQSLAAPTHPLRADCSDLLEMESGLLAWAGCVQQALDMLSSLSKGDGITVAELHRRIEAHRSLTKDYVKWQRFRAENGLFSALALDLDSNGGTSELPRARATIELAEALERLSTSDIAGAVLRRRDSDHYKQVMRFSRQLPDLLDEERRQREAFAELARLDIRAWLPEQQDIKAIHDRNRRALAAEDTLSDWLDFLRSGAALKQMGLANLSTALIRGELPSGQAQAALQASVCEVLAESLVQSGAGHVDLELRA